MITYSFAEKNGNAVIILSAENDEEALEYLDDMVQYPENFRMDILEKSY